MDESNIKAMCEAFEDIAEYAKAAACHTEDAHLLGYINQIAMWAEAADAAIAKAAGQSETISQPDRGARRNAETTEATDPTHSAVRKG